MCTCVAILFFYFFSTCACARAPFAIANFFFSIEKKSIRRSFINPTIFNLRELFFFFPSKKKLIFFRSRRSFINPTIFNLFTTSTINHDLRRHDDRLGKPRVGRRL